MSLIETIRADQLQARKEKNSLKANILTTLIGEAVSIGKNDGNRETTDAEVIALVKKFIKNINETINIVCKHGVNVDAQIAEVVVLEKYVPKQLSEEDLRQVIISLKSEISAGPKDMGKIMGLLKARYDGQYDGKMASTLAKEILT